VEPNKYIDYGDEGVGWPSYVDFLATFSFVLFIFIGSLLFIMHGKLGERDFEGRVSDWVAGLQAEGIDVKVEGRKIKFNLTQQVNFAMSSAVLSREGERNLRRVAGKLPKGLDVAGDCKVVVLGKADAVQYRGDPFGNWRLSAARALAVLRFLHNCEDCGYGREMRGKLVLLGEGDVESQQEAQDDRRVDLVIDCERVVER
jgi:flagellar motor protein MotB